MLKKGHIIMNTCALAYLPACANAVMSSPEAIQHAATFITKPFTESLHNPIMIGASVCLYFLGTIAPDFDKILERLGLAEHRTWWHTIYPVIALYLLSLLFAPLAWLAFGYLMHLFVDSPSVCGVCFFNPYGYDHYNKAKIKKHHFVRLYHSGGVGEYVILAITIVLTACYVYFMYIRKLF